MQRLILSGGCHAALGRQVRKEAVDLGLTHAPRVKLAVKNDETTNPLQVTRLSSGGKMVKAKHLPTLIEEFGLRIGAERLSAPGMVSGLPQVVLSRLRPLASRRRSLDSFGCGFTLTSISP